MFRNVLTFALAVVSLASVSCGPRAKPTVQQIAEEKKKMPATTKVTAFTVSNESLNIDKIGMRDGSIVPDGNRDLVFTATVEGPADALFIVNCSEKGEPFQGFRADTIAGHEELPPEFGSVVDVGRLTVWIAVVEDGKFVNAEGGTLGMLPVGPHNLKMYVPNTGTLRGGTHLRLYARGPSTGLVAGPVVPY